MYRNAVLHYDVDDVLDVFTNSFLFLCTISDIFVAGTTQFLPTVYCELMLLSMKWNDAIPLLEGRTSSTSSLSTSPTSKSQHSYITIPKKLRISFYIGFMLNAPLLPSYPCFVQYSGLSLGVVNALLHTNLTLAWGMQAWSIYHIGLIVKSHTAILSTGSAPTTVPTANVGTVVGVSSGEKKYL